MEYTIGAFSELAGLSIYTLRYYEQERLIIPSRKSNGQRTYSESDLSWIAFIVRLKETGMPIKEIRQYAVLREQGVSTLRERKAMLLEHRAVLEGNIQKLNDHLSTLDDKIQYYQDEIEKQELSS